MFNLQKSGLKSNRCNLKWKIRSCMFISGLIFFNDNENAVSLFLDHACDIEIISSSYFYNFHCGPTKKLVPLGSHYYFDMHTTLNH